MTLVSVVIPLYNQSAYILEAVNSILSSTYKDVEIIVINASSTDITESELSAILPNSVKVATLPNQGVCIARNEGISMAKGEYILALDSDDKIHPTFIEKAVSILDNHSNIGIVYAKAEYFGDKTGEWYFPKYNKISMLVDNLIPSFAMFRKVAWESVGGYKALMEAGGEDWEYWISLIENGWKPYRLEEILLYYRRHSMSKTANNYEKLHWDIYKKIVSLHPKLYSDNIVELAFPLFFRVFKELSFSKQLKFVFILINRLLTRPVTKYINRRNLKKIAIKKFFV